MRFFEKHNYESVEFLGNFFYKFEVLNEKNSFHYDKIVSTVLLSVVAIKMAILESLFTKASKSVILKTFVPYKFPNVQ